MTVTIGPISTKTNQINNIVTTGLSDGFEIGFSYGNKIGYAKDVLTGGENLWQINVKATFNAKVDTTNSNQSTTTYTTSTSAAIVLPPKRINVVDQMIFNQRTTLPYTAKVHVVPQLKFQNGFTAWGGGGSYQTNPSSGVLKDKLKTGDRNFQDFDFSRCDKILEDAKGNADPWMVSCAHCSTNNHELHLLREI